MNDLMNKIQNNLSTFSKGQRLIAKYIIEHYDKAAFLTGKQARLDGRRQRIHGGAFCHGAGLCRAIRSCKRRCRR